MPSIKKQDFKYYEYIYTPKNLILEKKTSTIQDDLEIKDLQLNQVLQAANIDPKSLGSFINLNHSIRCNNFIFLGS